MAYLEQLLHEVAQMIAYSPDGRNNSLYRAAIRLYDVVKSPQQQVYGYDQATALLEDAALRTGLSKYEIMTTLNSAWRRAEAADLRHVRWFAQNVPGPAAPTREEPEPESRPTRELASPAYQQQAYGFWRDSFAHLWAIRSPADAGRPTPAQWLAQNYGLSEDELLAARLGYNPTDRYDPLEPWGLPPRDTRDKRLWLPRGIVIPWWYQGAIHRLEIRRPVPRKKALKIVTVRGAANMIYNVDQVRPGQPALLVEGVMNARAVHQVAGDLVVPVALGASTWGREWRSILHLGQARPVLLCLDADPAGDAAVAWWIEVLGDRAMRWQLPQRDPAALLAREGTEPLRQWVVEGLTGYQHSRTINI